VCGGLKHLKKNDNLYQVSRVFCASSRVLNTKEKRRFEYGEEERIKIIKSRLLEASCNKQRQQKA